MTDEKVYDIPGAAKRLQELGFDYSERQVRRWAELRKLPFGHNTMNRKLWITEEALIKGVMDLNPDIQKRT